jgi:hypothetical protein
MIFQPELSATSYHVPATRASGAPSRPAGCDTAASRQKRNGLLDIGKMPARLSRSGLLTKLAGRVTCRLPEGPREIGLAGKAQRQRNIDQRPVPACQKRFRALKTPGADVAMRRLPDGLPEGPREMIPAQARDRCHAIETEIAFEVRLDVVQHPKQPAPIEPFGFQKRIGPGRGCAGMLLHQPCCDGVGERFDKQAAGGCLSPQLGRDGTGDLGQQRIFEGAFMFQRGSP